MRRVVALCILIALTAPAMVQTNAPAPKPIWLVIAPPMFHDAIAPLAEHRKASYDVRIATPPIEQAIKTCTPAPACILLVGDEEPGQDDQPWYLPAKRFQQHHWHKGQAPTFASDAAYGDRDADGLAEIPVGRIPARTPDQLDTAIKKILAWENQPPRPENLQAAFWACDPAFGPLARTFATPMALTQIDTRSPAWLQPWVLAGDPASAFCGEPAKQTAAFANALGHAALGVVMAHASREAIYVMQTQDAVIHFTPQALASQDRRTPAAPLIAIACHTADFTQKTPCLGETLLFMPNGPVACIGATAESHPLPNFYTGQTLLDTLGESPQRLGDLWTPALAAAARKRSWLYEALLRKFEADRGMQTDPRKLQRDHARLYALLGDPATRLPLPKKLPATLDVTDDGWSWQVPNDARPKQVTELIVQFRPAASPNRQADTLPPAPAALLQSANDVYRFETLARLGPDDPWQGTLDMSRHGKLRLLAVTPEALYVAAWPVTRSENALSPDR